MQARPHSTGRDARTTAANGPAAHPNSRFTVSAKQNPSYSPQADAPQGVPISALVFGGRRRTLAPLVYQARDWSHGVLVGAGMASETTAAATGDVGVVRRDPMAMKPFAGYNFADYWAHWLSMDRAREEAAGRLPRQLVPPRRERPFLWPGYGENLRVLAWIIDRCKGQARRPSTRRSARCRARDALDFSGLGLDEATIAELLAVDGAAWRREADEIGQYLESYGDRLPGGLRDEVERLKSRLDVRLTLRLQLRVLPGAEDSGPSSQKNSTVW